MNSEATFARRMLVVLISLAVALLALSLYFMGGPKATSSAVASGPGVFSRSAIGHAAIAEILQRLGVPVVKSRYASLSKLGHDGLLVIAEPARTIDTLRLLPELLRARRILLVLPKREGDPSQNHPGWIANWRPINPNEAASVLEFLGIEAEAAQVPDVKSWTRNDLGVSPRLPGPVQLIRSKPMRPLVASSEGILLGEFDRGSRRVWVLADPDVVENHGMREADNAAFAVALFDRLRGGAKVVFDETIHGYASQPPDLLTLLLRFPFVLATAQGALAIGLLLWATMGRFGKPEPVPAPLAPGKRSLLASAAKLIEGAGHQDVVLGRYVRETLREAARQLHAPPGQSEQATVAWLARVGAARGVEVDCAALTRRLDEAAAAGAAGAANQLAVARDLYRWKRGIIDGHSGDQVRH